MSPEISFQAFPGIFLRILGALFMLPIGQNLSGIGKLFALSFALSIYFCSGIPAAETVIYSSLPFEFLFGCILTLPAAITIDAVRTLGELFDTQRGVSFAAVYDPTHNQHNSVMAQLSSNVCLVILISAGLLENVYIALNNSFELFPIYSLSPEKLSETAVNVIRFISFVGGGMFQAFLVCAVIFILIDIASVFISKILTQSGINQEIFLLKTTAGLLLILALLKLDLTSSLLLIAGPQYRLFGAHP